MPPENDAEVAELLKPMLKKRLFVALSKAVARPEQMLPFVAEHLEYMNQRYLLPTITFSLANFSTANLEPPTPTGSVLG